MLAAAFATDVPIVALHLTRPPVQIPDREALGMPSHFEAARGAYVLRAYRPGQPRMGTVFVRGTVTTANLVSVLPELDARGLNVKIVAALSPQLFARQDAAYREATASTADRWDAMAITNGAFKLMADWVAGPVAARVLAVGRLGRPLADRRLGRRGRRRGAPVGGAHPGRDRAVRDRAGRPTGVTAHDRRRRSHPAPRTAS